MKQDALFKCQNSKLISINDELEYDLQNLNIVNLEQIENLCKNENKDFSSIIPNQKNQITAINIDWKKIELKTETYNEESLANLREYLKILEEQNLFAFIIPFSKDEFKDSDQADSFIKTCVHSARRIKDCVSVLGFSVVFDFLQKDGQNVLDVNSYTQWFINEMKVKHSHYLYFVNKKDLQNSLKEIQNSSEFKKIIEEKFNSFVLYEL